MGLNQRFFTTIIPNYILNSFMFLSHPFELVHKTLENTAVMEALKFSYGKSYDYAGFEVSPFHKFKWA